MAGRGDGFRWRRRRGRGDGRLLRALRRLPLACWPPAARGRRAHGRPAAARGGRTVHRHPFLEIAIRVLEIEGFTAVSDDEDRRVETSPPRNRASTRASTAKAGALSPSPFQPRARRPAGPPLLPARGVPLTDAGRGRRVLAATGGRVVVHWRRIGGRRGNPRGSGHAATPRLRLGVISSGRRRLRHGAKPEDGGGAPVSTRRARRGGGAAQRVQRGKTPPPRRGRRLRPLAARRCGRTRRRHGGHRRPRRPPRPRVADRYHLIYGTRMTRAAVV